MVHALRRSAVRIGSEQRQTVFEHAASPRVNCPSRVIKLCLKIRVNLDDLRQRALAFA